MPRKKSTTSKPVLTDDQRDHLAKLFADVPTRTVTRYEWNTDQGRQFIAEMRAIQVTGVRLRAIAEALTTSEHMLSGAIEYWVKGKASRGGRRRNAKLVRPARRGKPPTKD